MPLDFTAGCIRFDGFADSPVQSATSSAGQGGRIAEPENRDACRDERGDPAVHASLLPGDGAFGRRDRPGALAGHPSTGRGPARSSSNSCRSISRSKAEEHAAKQIYDEAVETITATRVALKHPTTTAEESPNAILRRRLELSVIHRPVYTIPAVPTNFRRELDVDIVRIATGGTYDDPGRMIGRDGAVSLRIVERGPVREAAPLRVQSRAKDREKGHQLIEVHDPEGDRRPFRAGGAGSRGPVSRSPAHGRAFRCAPGQDHHVAREVPDRAGLERVW